MTIYSNDEELLKFTVVFYPFRIYFLTIWFETLPVLSTKEC